jgi:type I restriction enzyme S subunit
MNAPLFRKHQITPHLKQQCGQANVNGTIMKNMLIAIAPRNEQKRIVKKVVELIDICDQLKANILASNKIQLNLSDTIAQKALN